MLIGTIHLNMITGTTRADLPAERLCTTRTRSRDKVPGEVHACCARVTLLLVQVCMSALVNQRRLTVEMVLGAEGLPVSCNILCILCNQTSR